MNSVTVWAPSNIALIKYWGKRNEKLILPHTDSFSMTLSDIGTTTEIISSTEDLFELDGRTYSHIEPEARRVFDLVKLFREEFGCDQLLHIKSKNNFPTAAGLASSASGMAALVFGLNHFYNLNLSATDMSRFARLGSGSASRSLWGGFVQWHKGDREDGLDSVGEQIFDENHWPDLRMVLNVVSKEKKPVSSREGMRRTVETSKKYAREWLPNNDSIVKKAIAATEARDISKLGMLVEENALLMHETMKDSRPSFEYLSENSWELINAVGQMRNDGIFGYVTMDAGPQVKILCLKNDLEAIMEQVNSFSFIEKSYISKPGTGPKILSE